MQCKAHADKSLKADASEYFSSLQLKGWACGENKGYWCLKRWQVGVVAASLSLPRVGYFLLIRRPVKLPTTTGDLVRKQ
jgi:hypothetical protein